MEEQREATSEPIGVQEQDGETPADSCGVQGSDGVENKVEESSCNLSETAVASTHETKPTAAKLGAGDLYTTRELETLFRVSRRTITNWNIAGIIKPTKVGKLLYYRSEDIERLVRGE